MILSIHSSLSRMEPPFFVNCSFGFVPVLGSFTIHHSPFTIHHSLQTVISPFKHPIALSLAFLAVLAFTACQPPKEALPPADGQTYFPVSVGGHELQLQLALTPAEQQKGLMSRDHLAEDHGMLFLFERPDRRGFWMHNTRIPLDIGYFDAGGQLVEVHKLFPYDETPVPSRSQEILIAVETNRGWYAAHGVKPGARIDLDDLRAALARRNHRNAALRP